MKKILIPKELCQEFQRVATENKIYLEGNILKIIESPECQEFDSYINAAKEHDTNNRKKRLEVTKQVQEQNKALTKSHKENENLMIDLKSALEKAESAKKSVAEQNEQLTQKQVENEQLMSDLKVALEKAENAKKSAENDLDVMQKRTQFELIGSIVTYALYVIVGTGVVTTALYVMAMLQGSPETTLIGNTWSNLFGILLTNSFSIIGTIMGVKYASKDESKTNK